MKKSNLLNLSFIILLSGIAILYWINIPITVTWDSQLYLLSAQSIFTDNMQNYYHWLREPLYPLFLKISGNQELNLNSIRNTQYVLIYLSIVFLTIYVSKLLNNPIYHYLNLITFILLVGYAATILQQSIIVVLTAFHIVVNIRIYLSKNINLVDTFMVTLLVTVTGLLSVILIFPSIINFIVLIFYKWFQGNYSLRRVFLSILLIVTFSFTTQLVWNIYKISNLKVANRIYDDSPYFWESSSSKQSLSERIYYLPSTALGILGITSEIYKSETQKVNAENSIFAIPINIVEYKCGRVFPGPPNVLEQIQHINLEYCQNQKYESSIIFFNKIIQTFFPLISLSALLIGCFTIISKQNEIKVIILFPILSLLPYIAGGFGISRYGVPFIVVTPFLIGYGILSLLKIRTQNET